MHPSLTAQFKPPPDLEPQMQMPPYELCWCGSGKKWKWCHRNREQQQPVPIGKLLAEQRAEMVKGYCLHPNASADACSEKIIRAHTVQRRGGLAAIAEEGHVISPKLGFEDIFKNDGQIVPRLHGVRDASTFMGFCGTHDDALFAPIEKEAFVLNSEAAFLLSFRAICYELYTKNASLRAVEIQRELDKGRPFEIQCAIQQHLHFYREGIKRGLRDLETWKSQYDRAYVRGDFGHFSFHGVVLAEALPLVACGAFHPEFSFDGNRLQIITRGDVFEHVCFNLTVVDGKSVAVFGWTGAPNGPSELFCNSFKSLPKEVVANAIFHLACEQLENTYFRPSWWNSQTDAAREHLIQRFRSGIGLGGSERRPDCLFRFEYSFSTAAVIQELTS